jgi:Tol biopolymer transport system component
VTYQWDGRRTETDPVNWDIYVQPVDAAEPTRLTNDPTMEFGAAWSPDGERIAFLYTVAPGRYTIHQISKMGGTPKTLSPPNVFAVGWGIDWSPDGQSIAFSMLPEASGRGLALMSPETGRVTRLTRTPIASGADQLPRFSPDGRTVAFIRGSADLYTVAVAGGAERRVTSDRLAIAGHDWTADGKELVFSSNRSGQWALWRIAADKSGADPQPVTGIGTPAFAPSIARNGNRLAYNEQHGDSDIWRAPVSLGDDGSEPRIGTPFLVQGSTRMDASPQVSRDGTRLVFASQRSGDQAIWVSDIDGRNSLLIAAFPGYPAGSPRWSPTGTRVVFDAPHGGHWDIFVVGAQGIPKPVPLTTESVENVVPSWSSDEKWIYFASDRTGRFEVWKVPADGRAAAATQITRDGGFAPFESRDGKFIYYVKGRLTGGIWRVPVEGGEETFVADGPTARFWGYWALLENGICFATWEGENVPALVHYFDFARKITTLVGPLDAPAIALFPRFAMTPDGKSILYVKDKPTTSDIMLVKNCR